MRSLSTVPVPYGFCSAAALVVLKIRCAPSSLPSPYAAIFATE